MNLEHTESLAAMLAWLMDLDRFSGCSDLYFRQVYTARIKALKVSEGYQALLAAVNNNNRNEVNES